MKKTRNAEMEAIEQRMKEVVRHPKTSKEAYEQYPVDELDPEEKWRKEFLRRKRQYLAEKHIS